MNLSESIDNVISMKLYSVQIPYSWYTINKSFGSNFFYIKGNSPGINNGDHDVKVEITTGTYTPTEIVSRINERFDLLRSVRNNDTLKRDSKYASAVDLSFGNTKVSYQLAGQDAKIIFEFDLVTELNEVRDFIDGDKWKICLWQLDQKLRDTTKYESSLIIDNEKASELEIQIAEKYRELIREILEQHSLSL
jgi:hypothetical protein